ncbi:MAG: hypothetical protein HQK79_16610 [Desulfobacterales bacterium]|nr:hypothetical protein [Desulfobacterales bacterium]MBF0397272.1 hypothetical protein [Desulfobacterales bacterium]
MSYKNNINKLFVILLSFLFAANAFSLEALDENEMSDITAQKGVAFTVTEQISMKLGITGIGISDTNTGNKLELNGFNFNLNLPKDGTVTVRTEKINNKTTSTMRFSNWNAQNAPMSLTVDTLKACNTNIGSLKVDNLVAKPDHLYVAGRNNGLDLDLGLKLDVGNVSDLNYPSNGIEVKGVHVSQTGSAVPQQYGYASGKTVWKIGDLVIISKEDPDYSDHKDAIIRGGSPNPNPSQWTYSGNLQTGNMTAGNPATLDSRNGNLYLNLPMYGSIRVEDFKMGGKSFGPIIAENLRMHYCEIEIPGR